MTSIEIEALRSELLVARKEIKNLRQQVTSLNHIHKNDVDNLQKLLQDFKCQSCKHQEDKGNCSSADLTNKNGTNIEREILDDCSLKLKPIGIIKTAFPEKRAVPRQPTIVSDMGGCIQLNYDVFNNPEHSLEGLEEFSHVWIIYHFHKNQSHPKAKVAPPRLGGEKKGVFSSRSPHRPCPIGLSLVAIDKIEDSKIFFLGTDMVDGTPVLDIKPYIPHYDNPITPHDFSINASNEFLSAREAPDGQETMDNQASGNSSTDTTSCRIVPNSPTVRVPNWIMAGPTLTVLFNERALAQINELGVNQKSISELLEADPRSVYLRTKHGSQIFTFQLGEATVTCKFDDHHSTVTVVQVRKTDSVKNTEPLQ